MTPAVLLPKLRSAALIEATHSMPCTLRIASFLGQPCRGDVMAVHIDFAGGKGMGTKVSDLAVVAGCDACHMLLDWRNKAGAEVLRAQYAAGLMQRVVCALVETHGRLLEAGVISAKDGEVIQ